MQYFRKKPGFCLQEYDRQIDKALARLALAVIEQKEESSRTGCRKGTAEVLGSSQIF